MALNSPVLNTVGYKIRAEMLKRMYQTYVNGVDKRKCQRTLYARCVERLGAPLSGANVAACVHSCQRRAVGDSRTEFNRILCTSKSEAAVTGNKKLRCRYVEADYRQTRSIARPLCDSLASCLSLLLTCTSPAIERNELKRRREA